MKILILSSYYHPEIAASLYLQENLLEHLAAEGMEVDLFVPAPTRNVTDDVRKVYRKRKREELYDGKVRIHRFPMYREPKNALARAMRYMLCSTVHGWYGLTRRYDLIFLGSTPPTNGLLGGILKLIRRKPLVYNVQDIFPDSLAGTGLTKKDSLLWKIGRAIEDFTYARSDALIVISEDFKRNIRDKGVPEEKLHVVYNWVDETAVVPTERANNSLFDLYGLDRNVFYVTYCGNIGLTQNMDMLLETAKELETIEQLHFVLFGEGAYKDAVEHKIREDGLKNVTLLPFQPYEKISEVFSLGDVGLVISKPGVGENSVPSKTWSILSAGRPVIASFDENELKQIIEWYDTGIFTQAGDRKQLTEAILTLYRDRERCLRCGGNGRQFILKNLTKQAGTAAYVEVIRSCAGKRAESTTAI